VKFHLDLDERNVPANTPAHAPAHGPASPPAPVPADPSGAGDGRRALVLGRPGRQRREPVDVPVLQQAVAVPAGAPRPGWFTVDAAGSNTLVVPAGARVRGDCCAESVHVHGEVLGRVRATGGLLLVGPGARVRGGVEGHGPVVVAGLVQASRGADAVVAHGRLDLACSARVVGAVCHEVVAIYEGARVTGVLRGLDRRRHRR